VSELEPGMKKSAKKTAHEDSVHSPAVSHHDDARTSSARTSARLTCTRTANGRTGTSTDAMGGSVSESSSSASARARGGTKITAGRDGRERLSWKATFIELCDDERQGSLSPRPSSEPCSESSSGRSAFFDADRMRTAALWKHMEEAWASNSRETMRKSLENRRVSAAAEAIGNIPEQLNSVVHNKAKNLADSVMTDLSLAQMAIRRSGGDDDVVDVAINQLGKIPEIVRSSFDSRIMEANGAIRMKLSAIMHKFPERQDMVTQLWTIPEELEQITGEAVDQAVQESKREATRHCDRVLRHQPKDARVSRRALKDAKLQIAETVPEMYSETMRALRRTTTANVKHAVAHVDDPSEVTVPNRLIADVLLRAKLDTLTQMDGASMSISLSSHSAANIEEPSARAGEGAIAAPAGLEAGSGGVCHRNVGSMGHPEMCVRPCLYFLRGQCTNGGECRFCHYQHPTRAVHLGRQHRQTLEAATNAECFSIALPILERKMTTLNLATDTLKTHASQQCAGLDGDAVEAGSRVKPREMRTLEKAFGALSMRSLLGVIHRKARGQGTREKALVEALLLELRDVGFLVDIGEEAREDA